SRAGRSSPIGTARRARSRGAGRRRTDACDRPGRRARERRLPVRERFTSGGAGRGCPGGEGRVREKVCAVPRGEGRRQGAGRRPPRPAAARFHHGDLQDPHHGEQDADRPGPLRRDPPRTAWPANLTKRWTFRGGGGRAEIAMRLTTGVLGTPMPSFIDSVEKPDDIWHLANYLASLGPESPHYATLLTAEAVNGDIPADPVAEFWKRMAPQNIPLVGKV